jgi:GTPase Era involved in 16S rRNA processing
VQRARRKKSGLPLVALVGYTNAGKSAVMNHMLRATENGDKTVLEQDMLFATLDPYRRRIHLRDNKEFILIDTVGFVSKLPHSLVKAFRATLEEVTEAELLVHIVDGAHAAPAVITKTASTPKSFMYFLLNANSSFQNRTHPGDQTRTHSFETNHAPARRKKRESRTFNSVTVPVSDST